MDGSPDSRLAVITDFLAKAGWSDATPRWLGQDASTRRYARLIRADRSRALLMDAPPIEADPCPPGADDVTRNEMGWNAQTRLAASRVEAFALIADHLRSLGLSAPRILAIDSGEGLALIEDFGEGREFARLIERGELDEVSTYTAAAETLAHLHSAPVPTQLAAHGEHWPILEFDALALKTNADLYADWLPHQDGGVAMSGIVRRDWEAVRDALVERAVNFPRTFTLRDYHAENLIWLDRREGVARVGLLDFQDAVIGWDAWDMAMLTQDARRAVSPAAGRAAITRYLDITGKDQAAFEERFAVIGALNALRIAGVFSRLMVRDNKPRYGQFMPRQLSILARNLSHPALADMQAFVRAHTPFVFEARP